MVETLKSKFSLPDKREMRGGEFWRVKLSVEVRVRSRIGSESGARITSDAGGRRRPWGRSSECVPLQACFTRDVRALLAMMGGGMLSRRASRAWGGKGFAGTNLRLRKYKAWPGAIENGATSRGKGSKTSPKFAKLPSPLSPTSPSALQLPVWSKDNVCDKGPCPVPLREP